MGGTKVEMTAPWEQCGVSRSTTDRICTLPLPKEVTRGMQEGMQWYLNAATIRHICRDWILLGALSEDKNLHVCLHHVPTLCVLYVPRSRRAGCFALLRGEGLIML